MEKCVDEQHTTTVLFHVTSHHGLDLKFMENSVNILLKAGTLPEVIHEYRT